MALRKIFGWVLLIGGLILIIWVLSSSYNIFIGKTEAPELFKTEEKITEASTEIQKQLEEAIEQQLKGLLPTDSIPKILNLGVFAMLAWLLIFGGAQISGLGIRLIKS